MPGGERARTGRDAHEHVDEGPGLLFAAMSHDDLDLSKIWLFSTSSAKDLRTIRRALEEVTVPPGRMLCEQGTIGREFFLIVKGQAAVRRNNRKVATLGPGQYFGEMALLDRRPRSATVTSETDMTLLVLGPAPVQRRARRGAGARRARCWPPWPPACARRTRRRWPPSRQPDPAPTPTAASAL